MPPAGFTSHMSYQFLSHYIGIVEGEGWLGVGVSAGDSGACGVAQAPDNITTVNKPDIIIFIIM